MQEKESVMVVGCELKIPSLRITEPCDAVQVSRATEFSIPISKPSKILIVLIPIIGSVNLIELLCFFRFEQIKTAIYR